MLNVLFLSLSGSFFYSMYKFIVRCCMFMYALILLSVFRFLIVFCRIVNLIFYLIFYSVNLFSYLAASMSNKFLCFCIHAFIFLFQCNFQSTLCIVSVHVWNNA